MFVASPLDVSNDLLPLTNCEIEHDPLQSPTNSTSTNTVEPLVDNNAACQIRTDIVSVPNETASAVESPLRLSSTSENEYNSLQDSNLTTFELSAIGSIDISNQNISNRSNEIKNQSVMTELSNSLGQLRIEADLCNTSVGMNESCDPDNANSQQVSGINLKAEMPFMPLNEVDSEATENVFHSSFENCSETDDDVMICKNDEIPMPACEHVELDFMFKNNDIVSGTMAFAENVSNNNYQTSLDFFSSLQ